MPPIIGLMLEINQVSSDALDRAEADIKKSLKILKGLGDN